MESNGGPEAFRTKLSLVSGNGWEYVGPFLTSIIFLVALCFVLRPMFEEGLPPGVEGHGELLHLITIDIDLQFFVFMVFSGCQ